VERISHGSSFHRSIRANRFQGSSTNLSFPRLLGNAVSQPHRATLNRQSTHSQSGGSEPTAADESRRFDRGAFSRCSLAVREITSRTLFLFHLFKTVFFLRKTAHHRGGPTFTLTPPRWFLPQTVRRFFIPVPATDETPPASVKELRVGRSSSESVTRAVEN